MSQRPIHGAPRPNLPAMADELAECAWRYARICCPPEASHEDLVRLADQILVDARMRVLKREPVAADASDPMPNERTAHLARAS